ncbi:MAG: alcohol dehydrogenase catalytic domain-containing protein, partial [Pseudomonadota bacterium]
MRALVCEAYGPPEDLILKDLDVPEVGPGQVRVSVKAAAINFPDLLVIAGQYQVKTPPPFVPGSEAAGVVDAVGEGVTQYSPGDEVIVVPTGGAFGEYCVADQHFVMPKPQGLDFVTAAGFTITYGTSYHALADNAELKEGETLLVLGAAGGVGIAAVEIAKSMGAKVIAAASSEDKLEFAKRAGADEFINYETAPLK